ncbi:hypothetical protein [Methanocalculus natronophilus]|uniref:hypothetical protein n=1 Tax=Methanocalculus natronophilus TaxID=1262400 RepID=UPI0031B5FC92
MEIGGFFHFPDIEYIDSKNSVLHYLNNSIGDNKCLFIQDGRQAIKFVLQQIQDVQQKNCYLPTYLCHSIIQPFQEMRLNIFFYDHIHPLTQNIDENVYNSIILIIDYFGTEFYLLNQIKKLLENGNSIILDVTHSLLDKSRLQLSHKNLFYISSLRKTFPIPDGGVILHSNIEFDINMEGSESYVPMLDAMILKRTYLNKNYNLSRIHNMDVKNLFMVKYKKYEEDKDCRSIALHHIPQISLLILSSLDINTIVERRWQNIHTLYDCCKKNELFLYGLNDIKSPFMVPLVLHNNQKREDLQSLLINNGIYPPIHWDIKGIVPGSFLYEHQLSKKILSVPIDQRYDSDQMTGICKILNQVKT